MPAEVPVPRKSNSICGGGMAAGECREDGRR
jgi:hypothetical protein